MRTVPAWAAVALAYGLTGAEASATDPRYAHLIDAACLTTGIEQQRMAANMVILKARELSRDQAANMPAERAWVLEDNGTAVIVGYGARIVDGQRVRECTLGFRDGGHAGAMRAVETSYRLKRALNGTQGTQQVTAYTGDLVGLPDALITIQSMSTMPGVHTVTVTQGARLPR